MGTRPSARTAGGSLDGRRSVVQLDQSPCLRNKSLHVNDLRDLMSTRRRHLCVKLDTDSNAAHSAVTR